MFRWRVLWWDTSVLRLTIGAAKQRGEATYCEKHKRLYWNQATGRVSDDCFSSVGLLLILVPDRGKVCIKVIGNVDCLDPDPFTIYVHRKSTGLEAGLCGQ